MDIKKVLRWIAVLPAAIAGSFVAYLLGKLFSWFAVNTFFTQTGGGEDSFVTIIITALANYACGAGWVYFGSIVAPSHVYRTAKVLTVLALCVACVSIGIERVLDEFKWYQYLYIALCIVGAVNIMFRMKEEEKDGL